MSISYHDLEELLSWCDDGDRERVREALRGASFSTVDPPMHSSTITPCCPICSRTEDKCPGHASMFRPPTTGNPLL